MTVFKAKNAPHNPRVKPTPLEWLFVLVVAVQKKATAIKQTANAFEMAFCVVYRSPQGGKSGRPNKNKQEKEKEKRKRKRNTKKGKKEKKGKNGNIREKKKE